MSVILLTGWGGLPDRDSPQDRDPWIETPQDRPHRTETPRQRPPFPDRDPPNKDPCSFGQRPPRQRPPCVHPTRMHSCLLILWESHCIYSTPIIKQSIETSSHRIWYVTIHIFVCINNLIKVLISSCRVSRWSSCPEVTRVSLIQITMILSGTHNLPVFRDTVYYGKQIPTYLSCRSNATVQNLSNSSQHDLICQHIGVFPKWSRTFIEFSEFRESHKSLKHQLGSI